MSGPGRICPLRYRYGAAALAQAALRPASTLYVVGGLYGNLPALDEIDAMAQAEPEPPTLCFNGDFNWFDIEDGAFEGLNRRVLAHDAILGNVEAELDAPLDEAGCGCAYPASVDDAVVARSNQIHGMLKATAHRHPALLARIASLPMYARYRVADCRIGVVHGDADALAGWGFDVDALEEPAARAWLASVFTSSQVDLFASTHTCLPAMRRIGDHCVVNNGAAGMPNFAGECRGLVSRIGTRPSPHPVVGEILVQGAYVALLPVRYDAGRWQAEFQRQWPPGSPAWLSYAERIAHGPAYSPERALAGMDEATVGQPG